MALRLIEMTGADTDVDRLRDLLAEHSLVDLWVGQGETASSLVRIVVDSPQVESVSDALMTGYGSNGGFRLTVSSLEATLPKVEEPDARQEEQEEGSGRSRRLRRISRDELYEDLSHGARLTPTYMVMVALSAMVAAVGLIRGDVAVIVGAMVIAPLLEPNIALSLAATLGDLDLARRSLKTAWVGALIASAISIAVGMALTIDPTAPQVAGRTNVGLGDIVLALSAGAAGTLAFTSGVPAVVVGVMVAVALLPPLVAAGLLLGAGQIDLALQAVLLVLTNVTCINLAAVTTFYLQDVRPRAWWEENRAKKATRIASAIWVLLLVVLVVLILLSQEPA